MSLTDKDIENAIKISRDSQSIALSGKEDLINMYLSLTEFVRYVKEDTVLRCALEVLAFRARSEIFRRKLNDEVNSRENKRYYNSDDQ